MRAKQKRFEEETFKERQNQQDEEKRLYVAHMFLTDLIQIHIQCPPNFPVPCYKFHMVELNSVQLTR